MNDIFGSVPTLAPECQKCAKVWTCNHRRMAKLGYIIPVGAIRASGKLEFQKQYFEALKRGKHESS